MKAYVTFISFLAVAAVAVWSLTIYTWIRPL
jgi:hypothetical protein